MPIRENEVVAGRFRLVSELGRGGMGSVWRAHHVAVDTPCAVKFIEGEAPGARSRFEREAKAAAQLRSAHVVQILDHGVWEDTPYIAMELLEGEDLRERLSRVGRLSPAETVAIVSQIARALGKAHAMGIVHRDLKPDNVFLVRDDDREIAKVLDFGIAKTAHTDAMSKTATGAVLGTPHYMSPEQAEGIRPVDFRTDLWSLGVIAFECVTGRRPFDSEALGDLLNRIMNKSIPKASEIAPDVPSGFDAWWARACARPLEERFHSAKDLASALAETLGVERAVEVCEIPARAVALDVAHVETLPQVESGTPATSERLDVPTIGGQAGPPESVTPAKSGRRAFAVIALGAIAALALLALVMSRPDPGTERASAEGTAPLAPPEPAAVPALVEPRSELDPVVAPATSASSPAGSASTTARPAARVPRRALTAPPIPSANPAVDPGY